MTMPGSRLVQAAKASMSTLRPAAIADLVTMLAKPQAMAAASVRATGSNVALPLTPHMMMPAPANARTRPAHCAAVGRSANHT